jgi:hypothetical protein
MPQIEELRTLSNRQDTLFDARYRPAEAWIATRGESVYVRWLIAHPFARLAEVAGNLRKLVGFDEVELRLYLPPGWRAHGLGYKLRDLPARSFVLVALALVWLVVVWRRRSEPLARLAACVVVSGFIGSVAAFYGDASELARHCYGSGQQIAFGLFLAALVALDGLGARDAPPVSTASAPR